MENSESTAQQNNICPVNSVEDVNKEGSISQETQPDRVKSMYCKELAFQGGTEYSFEELHAQYYYERLKEKALNLNRVKEHLKFQIEQKQKRIQERNGAMQHQQLGVPQDSPQSAEVFCAPVVSREAATPLQVYNETETSRSSTMSNINHEDMGQVQCSGTTGVTQRSSQTSKPFVVYDENVLPEKPNTRSSSVSLKSLKLPTCTLKARQAASECSKESSLSRSEEVIINAHLNKTVCRSPDDTCDFIRAAQLASTPFGGLWRPNPPERSQMEENEAFNKPASAFVKEPNTEARTQTNTLSPIQEISHEVGYNSLASICQNLEPESQGMATVHSGITDIIQPTSEKTVSVHVLDSEMENPCSLDVRKVLLDHMDLTSFANFSRKVGPVPDPDDLSLDGERLFFIRKMGDQGIYFYRSNGGSVLVKVDESTIPWDFYINSQLRSRLPIDLQHSHPQSTCYLYENGSFTLWQIPQGHTIQELLEDHMDRRNVPHLAIQLLEMVKQMHSCHIVHGALRPETLMVCHSEDRIICMDFSNALDLELQTNLMTVQSLPSAQDYIKQGFLLPTASPYQVDLCGIAELVHLLLFKKNMKIIKDASYWSLAEDSEPLDCSLLAPLWQHFFHTLLNPEDDSTKDILSKLINNIKNTPYNCFECPFSL